MTLRQVSAAPNLSAQYESPTFTNIDYDDVDLGIRSGLVIHQSNVYHPPNTSGGRQPSSARCDDNDEANYKDISGIVSSRSATEMELQLGKISIDKSLNINDSLTLLRSSRKIPNSENLRYADPTLTHLPLYFNSTKDKNSISCSEGAASIKKVDAIVIMENKGKSFQHHQSNHHSTVDSVSNPSLGEATEKIISKKKCKNKEIKSTLAMYHSETNSDNLEDKSVNINEKENNGYVKDSQVCEILDSSEELPLPRSISPAPKKLTTTASEVQEDNSNISLRHQSSLQQHLVDSATPSEGEFDYIAKERNVAEHQAISRHHEGEKNGNEEHVEQKLKHRGYVPSNSNIRGKVTQRCHTPLSSRSRDCSTVTYRAVVMYDRPSQVTNNGSAETGQLVAQPQTKKIDSLILKGQPQDGVNTNVWDKLYNTGIIKMARNELLHQQVLQAKTEEKVTTELQSCTFHPNIATTFLSPHGTPRERTAANDGNTDSEVKRSSNIVFERLNCEAKARQYKLDKIRKNILEKEEKEITEMRAKHVPRQNTDADPSRPPLYERLYRMGDAKKKQKEAIANRPPLGTFRPQLREALTTKEKERAERRNMEMCDNARERQQERVELLKTKEVEEAHTKRQAQRALADCINAREEESELKRYTAHQEALRDTLKACDRLFFRAQLERQRHHATLEELTGKIPMNRRRAAKRT